MGVADGGEDRVMTENLLDLEEIDTRLNQVGGIGHLVIHNSPLRACRSSIF
jgi:hypothetical protein